MQGAPPLAPVPGKARKPRKADVRIPLSHVAWGFVSFSNSNSAVDDSISIEYNRV